MMKARLYWLRSLVLIALFALSTGILANSYHERVYQIELIVFSHLTPDAVRSEQWPWTPPTIRTSYASAVDFLGKSAYHLALEERLLSQRKDYNVLMHVAWQQKISGPKNARPVHIYGGNVYSASGQLIDTARYGQRAYNGGEIWQVNGTITPSLVRYIDLKCQLLFAQPINSIPSFSNHNENIEGRFAYFRLQETRRLKSNELNYLDHPLYGVLIKVTPVV